MKPNPHLEALLAQIRAKPPARGARRRGESVPANMAAAVLESEARAWNHSPMAGMLWESGVRAARAITWAESLENNCCKASENVASSECRPIATPAPADPGILKPEKIMKNSTLHTIAHHIRKELRREVRATVDEMTETLQWHCAEAKSKREAAYIIMTEVFELIDDENEDRNRINSILSQYPGEWEPIRLDHVITSTQNPMIMKANNYHNEPVEFSIGQTITHVSDDGTMTKARIIRIDDGLLDLAFEDGDQGSEQPSSCF